MKISRKDTDGEEKTTDHTSGTPQPLYNAVVGVQNIIFTCVD